MHQNIYSLYVQQINSLYIHINLLKTTITTLAVDITNPDFEEELKQAVERRTRVSVGRSRVQSPGNIWGHKISPLRAKTPLFLKVRALCHKRGDGKNVYLLCPDTWQSGHPLPPPNTIHHTYAQAPTIYYNSMVLLQGLNLFCRCSLF